MLPFCCLRGSCATAVGRVPFLREETVVHFARGDLRSSRNLRDYDLGAAGT
jgi:hypothetical protein